MMLSFEPLFEPLAFSIILVATLGFSIGVVAVAGRSGLLRAVTAGLMVLVMANPTLSTRETKPLKSVIVVAVDRSGSQTLSTRAHDTDQALAEIKEKLSSRSDSEALYVEGGGTPHDGTQLFAKIRDALIDQPQDRIGGLLLLTDGLIDDIPKKAGDLGFDAPIHALITGSENERDRRVALVESPPFGLVGHEQTLKIRVSDPGQTSPVPVTIKLDGKDIAKARVTPGETFDLPVKINHAGPNIVEIEADAVSGELTRLNNRAVVTLEGIRDRLTVLLVSGIPHQGERSWRSMLKSDSNVDLVHFTILRPPEKQDGTPVNELALIAFPTKDLFETKIDQFDLIILDRFADMALLPANYYANIVRYVRKGGAILIAAGPEYAGPESPAETPLRDLLPAFPTGKIIDMPFIPALTNEGRKHPVTRDLKGAMDPQIPWGPWMRLIETGNVSGTPVMSGPNNQPLLVLRRDGEGRVALLLSDHVWLWARNYQGGGPHLDLLRRVGHWLMKEPSLEENALRARADETGIVIERQSMAEAVSPVSVEGPSGQKQDVTLSPVMPGLWRATLAVDDQGLYKVTDGNLTAFASKGPANPREYQDVISTTARLQALAQDSGGSVRRLKDNADKVTVPEIRLRSDPRRSDSTANLTFRDRQTEQVIGLSLWSILQGPLGLILVGTALLALWLGESGLITRRGRVTP